MSSSNGYNIILFGETGTERSFVVDLLAGRPVAEVPSNLEHCTFVSTRYTLPFGSTTVRIWDTVGLEKPTMAVNGYLAALEKVHTLIRDLGDAGGVDLLLFCMRDSGITATTQSDYQLFHEVLCNKDVPIALVITHLETEVAVENWWMKNEKSIQACGIHSVGHVYITRIEEDEMHGRSKDALRDLIQSQMSNRRTFRMQLEPWFARLLTGLRSFKRDLPRGEKMDRTVCRRFAKLVMGMATPVSERVYNVALFGVTGCGKSSIVNLLADKPVADISTGVDACTRRARWYPITVNGKKFRLWDTMGFNQDETNDMDPLSPYERAHALLRNLQDGVDLILLCARKDGINASLRNLYWLLNSFFFGGRAQIALVLTHFDVPDDQWWGRNSNAIAQRCDIPVQFLPYACITTTQNELLQPDPLYDQSKRVLRALLQEYATTSTPTPLSLDLSSDTAITTAVEGLYIHCQLSIHDATTLVEKFGLPRRPFRVILFGESGAGKSSVINLVVGESVAKTSPGINGCALEYHSYKINTGMHQFLVWDTVGLNNEQNVGHKECGKAIQNAVRLIHDLHQQGGIDLLVFCKKSGRFLASELNNLRLFHEFLCEGQVPIAFIITHLEHLNPMEKWWEENGDGFVKACSLKGGAVAGHACITSLPLEDPQDQKLHDKRTLSRQMVQTMLEDSISYGSAFSKYEKLWVMQFLRRFVGMMKVGHLSKKERLTIKNVMERCQLSKEQAEELIRLLCEP